MLRSPIQRAGQAIRGLNPKDPVVWLIVVGAALRFAVAIGHRLGPASDFVIYHRIARTLATAGDYGQAPGVHEAYWPPGWPAFLSVGYWIFGAHPVVGELLAAGLGTATLILAATIANRLLRRPFAIAAVAVLALNPAWILFTSVLATEHLAAFLVTAILALLVLAEPRTRTAVAIGALEGALLLTRADIGLAALACIAAAAIARRPAHSVRLTAIGGLALVLVLTPWTVRNVVRFHEFIPLSANGGFALYRGTFEVIDATIPDPDPPPAASLTESPGAYNSYYLRKAAHQIRLHPVTWMGYNAQRLKIQYLYDRELLAWVGWPELSQHIGRITDWIWRVLVALVLAGTAAVATRFAPWRIWLPALALIAATVVVTSIFPGAARRHYPVIPAVCLIAALGAQAGLDLYRRRRVQASPG
jgi:hypothetical protein